MVEKSDALETSDVWGDRHLWVSMPRRGRARRKLLWRPPMTALLLSVLAGVLLGCSPIDQAAPWRGHDILLWHSWSAADTAVLEQTLGQISEVDPDVQVVAIHVPPAELLARYIDATAQGIGPDLLIGPSSWLNTLVAAEALRPIPEADLLASTFRSTALDAVRVDDRLYGLPLAVAPAALYVNTSLADESPATLEETLSLTTADRPLAFVPRFDPAYWGIAAFGDGLFDGQGRFTLAESGFTEWLIWLEEAQTAPGIILNSDAQALRDLFLDGRAAYYVAGPDELSSITDRLGRDSLAVTRLPSGPHGPAGPLLAVEAVMLGTNSSEGQALVAQAVAAYLTNPQQSTIFLRETARIPANLEVAVDPRIYPLLAGFARQATTAVALPSTVDAKELERLGDRAYVNALTGLMSPEEAVCQFGLSVIAAQGYTADQVDLPSDCAYASEQGE